MNEIKDNKDSKTKEKHLVYVVDDEGDILELICIHLIKAGYEVEKFTGAAEMLSALNRKQPDLLVLDLMLPDMDGLDVCKRLKGSDNFGEIPIVMVTARTDELDIVLGLELGADDYITKPFSPRELTARVKAVLRRGKSKNEGSRKRISFGNILAIDPEKYEVHVEGERINLTSTEFLLLKTMAEKPGWVFSREKILDRLWKDEKDVFDRTVDVHIKNLREKLGRAGKLVKNIRGVGYKLELD